MFAAPGKPGRQNPAYRAAQAPSSTPEVIGDSGSGEGFARTPADRKGRGVHYRSTTARAPTARQLEVLQAIARLTRELGFPPTFRELGESLGIESGNGIVDHLNALERHGWVTRMRRTARSLLLTRSGSAWVAWLATAQGGRLLLGSGS